MTVWNELQDVLDRYDGDIKIDSGSLSAWAATLRLTLTDPYNEPSRSITFHTTGAIDPYAATVRVLADFQAWQAETGAEPCAVPDWMKR